MEFFDATDVRRVCSGVRRFSQKANWRFRALPVMTWEFASRHDFEDAHATLKMCLDREMLPTSARAIERIHDDHSAEIDAHGVTFRLVFKEV